ncbi:hypothetical protein FBQ87_02810 [Sphingobacteriales bacterium CHB3]|nr:hypothetical protein [Sphingobacteriales bacterium CHB3]
MIKNPEEIVQADLEFDRKHPLTVEQKYRIIEALYRLAKDAGHFNPNDTSIDVDDIKLAKVLNGYLPQLTREDRQSF